MGVPSSKNVQHPVAPKPVGLALPDVTDFLLQPQPDKSIRESWIILRGMIESHVNGFYVTGPLSLKANDLSIQIYQSYNIINNQQEAERLAALMCCPIYRQVGMRICVARVLLASTNFYGDFLETALDRGTVQMMSRFRELNPQMSPGKVLLRQDASRVRWLILTYRKENKDALASWRMITAFFLQRSTRDHTATKDCVQTLLEILEPFTSDCSQEKAEAHRGSLQDLCLQAVEIAESLFSHPSEWTMEWRAPSSGVQQTVDEEPPIIVFPALYRSSKRRERLHLIQEASVIPGVRLQRTNTPSNPGIVGTAPVRGATGTSSPVIPGTTTVARATDESPSAISPPLSLSREIRLERSQAEAQGSPPQPLSRRSTYERSRRDDIDERLSETTGGSRRRMRRFGRRNYDSYRAS